MTDQPSTTGPGTATGARAGAGPDASASNAANAELATRLSAAAAAEPAPEMPSALVEAIAVRHRMTVITRGVLIALAALVVLLAIAIATTGPSDDGAARASSALEAETEPRIVDRSEFMLFNLRDRDVDELPMPSGTDAEPVDADAGP